MGFDVGVVGASGYAGAELLRLLLGHPSFRLRTVAGSGSAGSSLHDVAPWLGLDRPVVAATSAELTGCDIVFLATPHEVSLALAPELLAAGVSVIDLSGAFRLPPAEFEQWYGRPHSCPDVAPGAYGLPELHRQQLAGARLIANPGCYPTAALLALAPIAGLVRSASVVITGMSGTSGAGKGLRDDLHFSHAAGNVTAYGAPRHRHTPEIAHGWAALTGSAATVSFTPHLVPMSRGLVCTVAAELVEGADAGDVAASLEKLYGAEAFVRLMEPGTWPASASVRGTNVAAVGAAVDEEAGRVTVSCAIDNLVKGAAGQALQNANIVAGIDEQAGLPTAAIYP